MKSRRPHLSKSRLVAGWKCPSYLWLRVHDAANALLRPSSADIDRMEQGTAVGDLARGVFPEGVLIDLPHDQMHEKVRTTREALVAGVPAIFEASFWEDDVFVAVDVLERLSDGAFRLIEVKSSTKVKPEHDIDVAVQLHVLRKAGLDVREVVLMHLDPKYRYLGGEPLFALENVTDRAEALVAQVPCLIERCNETLALDAPPGRRGATCARPCTSCPLGEGCWPADADHIRWLTGVGASTALEYMERGVHRLDDLSEDDRLSGKAARQLQAWRQGGLVVEATLANDLEAFRGRLGFLDFETVSRAVPVWPGLGPWAQVPAQFSYHERGPDGVLSHREWLAEGPDDPREAIARELLDTTNDADRVVTYSPFEGTCIRALQKGVPALASDLEALRLKLIDLQKVVANNLAHPDFRGSFSIKDVLTPLVPDLSYANLPVGEGQEASVRLYRFMAHGADMGRDDYQAERSALLEYCKLDTLAMVRLLDRLEGLVAPSDSFG